MKKLSLLAVVLTGVLLLLAEKDFPDWADPNSAANAGMSQHYIKNSFQETKVDNLVTALLADYRGFDTMFETAVIFTACLAIMAILRVFHTDETWHKPTVKDDLIIQTTCRILIPIIQILALYVLFHGHVSPGGGFQAGVIFGASLILMAIAFNLETAMKRLSESKALILISAGVLIYAGIGLICMMLGENFLDYSIISQITPFDSVKARYHSMLGVEIGVGFTVTCSMFLIYANLSSNGHMKDGI